MNLQKMMKQMQKMQKQMLETQKGLETKEVEVSVGGGKVTVRATGAGDVVGIKIAPEVVDRDDVEMLEDLILSGVKQAIEKGKDMAAQELKKVTDGLPIPPGMGGGF